MLFYPAHKKNGQLQGSTAYLKLIFIFFFETLQKAFV